MTRMSRKQFYTQDEVDAIYEQLEPIIEAFHQSITSGYALAAALKKHADEIRQMEDEVMAEELAKAGNE